MELDKDYLRFSRWWEESQRGFYCGQLDERQIAHAAWIEGQKEIKKQMSEPVYYSSGTTACDCANVQNVCTIGTIVVCAKCGRLINTKSVG